MKVFNASQMKQIDELAINAYNIPGCVLMENAGRETVRLLTHERGNCSNTYAIVLVGPGNNGGDGLVIGRHLYQLDCQPIFVFLTPPDQLPENARLNYTIIEKIGLTQILIDENDSLDKITDACQHEMSHGRTCYCCIDALFGIGLTRQITGQFYNIIQKLNNQTLTPNASEKPFVVSCDIPSGINSNSGIIHTTAVKADLTATYSAGKPGLYTNAAPTYCGRLHIVDIGIPKIISKNSQSSGRLTLHKSAQFLLNSVPRVSHSHKGTNGHLGIIAGSKGMTGAAILSANGGLRSGAGLVSLVIPETLNAILETALPEAMTIPAPGSLNYLGEEHLEYIVSYAKKKNCLLMGPGLGQQKSTENLVGKLYCQLSTPMVVDADAINILARFPELLESPGGPRIFTPHPTELSRVLQCETTYVQNDRLSAIQRFIERFSKSQHEVIGLLKGNGTLIASSREDFHQGEIHINTTGNCGMATGGMGDVLSGIIGGLICQGYSNLAATKLGAFLHGMAADNLWKEKGIGFTASEVCEAIPKSRQQLMSDSY